MFSPFERMVAGRYLRSRKAEGFVSVIAGFSFLGIMLGVATLIIVMAVMNGFRQELITRILGLNGHINVFASSGPLEYYDELVTRIGAVPGVTMASAQIESQALMTSRGMSTGVLVRGITAEDFGRKPILSSGIEQGTLRNFSGPVVAIGSALAERLQLKLGDDIVIISPKARTSPFGSIPRSRTYKIELIFDVGMYEYNNGFVYMPLDQAQLFFELPRAVTEIEVMTENPASLRDIHKAITTAVEGEATVHEWRESNTSFFNALQVERNVMFLILTMIILVAAFNVISSMIMLVKDKGRDIAIMRTMGATRRNMLKIFMLTGASIGLAGTFFGALAGIMFALNIETIRQWIQKLTNTELFSQEIYFLSTLPAEIDWQEVVSVIAMAVTLSILATLYPAWRAARLDPVEALRYE